MKRIRANRLAFLGALLLLALPFFSVTAGVVKQQNMLGQARNTQTCRHKEFEAFAFLEGEWNVLSNTRLPGGEWEDNSATSEIRRDLSGCLLIERYAGSREARPFTAVGFMGTHPVEGELRRAWMDSEHGGLVMYEGSRIGDAVLLDTEITLQGNKVKLRHAYIEIKGGSFTLESRRSSDDGKTWMTVWKARYQRKG